MVSLGLDLSIPGLSVRGGGQGGVAALTFPAQGYAYDHYWATDQFATKSGITQTAANNTSPLPYRQQITQAAHFVEDTDGTLQSRTTVPRRSTKGLHSWGRVNQRLTAPRDLTNAAWTKTDCTAAKDQTGRDGSANGASSLAFTANNGTATNAVTHASEPVILYIDIKRLTGSADLEISADNGSTYTSFPVASDGAWHRFTGALVTRANSTIILRGQSNNSYVIDFVQLMYPEQGIISPAGRVASATAIGRDRLNASLANSGSNEINVVRSLASHGLLILGLSTMDNTGTIVAATSQGFGVTFNGNKPRVVNSATSATVEHTDDFLFDTAGLGAVRNNFMYYQSGGVCRIALNGVLVSGSLAAPGTATTHDFLTNGAGDAMEGYCNRQVWFDDSDIPTDEEMIAWTTL